MNSALGVPIGYKRQTMVNHRPFDKTSLYFTKSRNTTQQPEPGGQGIPLCSTSRLAQLVERKTLNLVVVGSSPTVGGRRRVRARAFLPPLRPGYWRNRKRACFASTRYWDRNPDTPKLTFFFCEKKKFMQRPYSTQDSRMVPHCSTD